MEYVRLCQGFDFGKLIPVTEDIYDHIRDFDLPHFRSLYFYNEKHYEAFKATGSIRGITDVYTPFLAWDFDSADNVARAKDDAVQLCAKLVGFGIPQDKLRISFSGNKGFAVEIETNRRFTPEEFRRINMKIAEGLPTNDKVIFNASRIWRVACTRHNKSGLYKLPLTLNQLDELDIDTIRGMAEHNENDSIGGAYWTSVDLPEAIYALRIGEPEVKASAPAPEDILQLDFKSKPKGLTNCKFALLNGYFGAGQRDHACMVLAATLKYLGYPKTTTYYMLKAACEEQALRTGMEKFSKHEIWDNCISQVYSPAWKGGQYTCKTEVWLKEICDSLGPHKCQHEVEPSIVAVDQVQAMFEDYSLNIEQNTIKTGIAVMDQHVQLTVGMPVGLLGAPGSGKTSISLEMLENTSASGIDSVFFSFDMFGPLVYTKAIQRQTGLPSAQIHDIFKHDRKRAQEFIEGIKERYKHVSFCLKSGQTVAEMRNMIMDHQERTGRKVKLAVTDYLECIAGPYSDATANTAKIAGELKDMAIDMELCNIILVQPPKSAGDASSPLTSMRQVKGSSMLEQSFRVIFGIYREGFSTDRPEWDKFMTVAALKNTMGGLFKADCEWDGRTQRIREISSEGIEELNRIREAKKAEKAQAAKESDSWT